MSIRFKLLLLCLVMLSIPYVGFQYLRETERYLQSSLEESLGSVTSAMAIAMQFQSTIFTNSVDELSAHGGLFVHPVRFPIHIDGYADEWLNYVDWSETFTVDPSAVKNPSAFQPTLTGFKLVLAEHEQYLYALLLVDDADVVYSHSGDPLESSDSIEIVYQNTDLSLERLILKPVAPGPVTPYKLIENWDFSHSRKSVANVLGAWQETPQGYTVELRLPLHMVPKLLGLVVHDHVGLATSNQDQAAPESMFAAATNGSGTQLRPNKLLRTSAQLRRLINKIGLKEGQRVWVLNRNGQVLATGGSLLNEQKQGAINILYTWILPQASSTFKDELRTASRLQGSEVLSALRGKADTRWRSSPDERAVIVSAAHPVRAGNELVGAVVIEETTNSIQTIKRDAMASLYNKSIFVIVIATGIIMLFASRLSYRILRLRNMAERAIDDQGRIVGQIPESKANDELGDLSRSFTAMTVRLREYHDYLESMASKLSHEMRTPISVVSSSLDNLEQYELEAEPMRYLQRVREGLDRMQNLVLRLSEAARLEQAIGQAEKSTMNLQSFLVALVDSYDDTYDDLTLQFQKIPAEGHALSTQYESSDPLQSESLAHDAQPKFLGSAELIAEMMDKLIENAVQFCDRSRPITVTLKSDIDVQVITISNYGKPLPEEMKTQIFNSMVSVREASGSSGTHLGIGLYVARLVAEYHHGNIVAENLPGNDGVKFIVRLSAN